MSQQAALEQQALEQLRRGDLRSAHGTLKLLAQLRPGDPGIRRRIAQVEQLVHQRDEAQNRIQAEPLRYAHAYIKAGRLAEGLQLLRSALAKDPHNERLRDLALEVARRLRKQQDGTQGPTTSTQRVEAASRANAEAQLKAQMAARQAAQQRQQFAGQRPQTGTARPQSALGHAPLSARPQSALQQPLPAYQDPQAVERARLEQARAEQARQQAEAEERARQEAARQHAQRLAEEQARQREELARQKAAAEAEARRQAELEAQRQAEEAARIEAERKAAAEEQARQEAAAAKVAVLASENTRTRNRLQALLSRIQERRRLPSPFAGLAEGH